MSLSAPNEVLTMNTTPEAIRQANSRGLTEDDLHRLGYDHLRQLEDGTWLAVAPMTYGKGRLFIELDAVGFADCYCYPSVPAAIDAMQRYDQNSETVPDGWVKHPATGRFRPEGDSEKEVVLG